MPTLFSHLDYAPSDFDTDAEDSGAEAPTPSPPSFPWRLFSGQVTGWTADRDGGHLKLTLHAEDWNRMYSRGAVGAAEFGNFIDDGRGTLTAVDPAAQSFGGTGGTSRYRYLVNETPYWHGPTPASFDDEDYTSGGGPSQLLDWQTAGTTLGAALDEILSAYAILYGTYWVDADDVHHFRSLFPVGQLSDDPLPAPYGLSTERPYTSSIIAANISTGSATPDRPRRVFVQGGSPIAQAFFTDSTAPVDGGDAYVSAPGAQTADEAQQVADWAFAYLYRSLVRGEARPVSHRGSAGYHGWRVGQIVGLTEAELSRVTALAMANIAAPIQQVQGTWIGGDLTVTLGGVDRVITEISRFSFTEVVHAVGQADLVVTLWDPDGEVTMTDLMHLVVALPSGDTEMQYALNYGDIPPGSMARQTATPVNRAATAGARLGPVTDFIFLNGDPGIRDGEQTVIVAAAYEKGRGRLKKPGISHIWTILQDGDSYFLNPAEGTTMLTDSNGESAVELHRLEASGGSPSTYYQLQIDAVPL